MPTRTLKSMSQDDLDSYYVLPHTSLLAISISCVVLHLESHSLVNARLSLPSSKPNATFHCERPHMYGTCCGKSGKEISLDS